VSDTIHYGVKEKNQATNELDVLAEEIRMIGYTTLDAGYTEQELDTFSSKFELAKESYSGFLQSRNIDAKAINENDVIRVLPLHDELFWKIAFNDRLNELLERLLGSYFILNQINGLINRKNNSQYHQSKYHRDLPYQHFTSSRPLAINALFAVDDFTIDNGATRVIPASHHREQFPPEQMVGKVEEQVTVKRGTYIILDCMLYHAGSTNRSQTDRRAINNVFTMPMFRQQIHLPSLIGTPEKFSDTQKRILGFDLKEYDSLATWLESRS
jgi:ectoine hydroxylase-related dioxygenase (phytanoyl-CoA dioxygenase family)